LEKEALDTAHKWLLRAASQSVEDKK